MSLDEKDVRILFSLAEMGNGSPDRIHEEAGIPKSTVHYRLERLREEGVITNDLYDIDRDRLGLSMSVITEVFADYEVEYHDIVGNKLAEINGVNQVYFVMGDTDFIVISHLASQDDVEDLISDFESIKEINRTSSKFVIKTVRSSSSVLLDYDLEELLSVLGIDNGDSN